MKLRVKEQVAKADEIRDARVKANLTQLELALKLGVSPRTLQNWEAGIGVPRAEHRRRIAKFLENGQVAA